MWSNAQSLPDGWTKSDIGTPIAGSANFSNGVFSVTGGGAGIWGISDSFTFVNGQLAGDGVVVGRVDALSGLTTLAKAGVMMRDSLAAGATNAYLFVAADGTIGFQRRHSTGGITAVDTAEASPGAVWLKLARSGSTVTASYSADGVTWLTFGTDVIAMSSVVSAGLAVTSHSLLDTATVEFSQVDAQRPSVSLITPPSGASYTAPATVTMTASATDSDGTVARVDFYAGGALIGGDGTSPYSVAWNGVAPGTYTLYATAVDTAGNRATSARHTVIVAQNQAPAVSLTAPADGARYTAPAAIAVSASASDADGTVASVAFYAGATLIGSDTTTPYSVTWSNVPAGTYTLTAHATDHAGAVTVSTARSVTVTTLPAEWTGADIGQPAVAGSATYNAGTFTLEGAGADIWDTSDQFQFVFQQVSGDIEIISRVVSLENTHEWAKAGVMVRETLAVNAVHAALVITPGHGTNFYRRLTPGDVTQPGPTGPAEPPYWVRLERRGSGITAVQSADGVTWTAVGTMTLATPTIYVGLVVTSHDPTQAATGVFDNVVVRTPSNQAPTVALTAPADGARYTAPAAIAVSASASDTDGTVASVAFYAGTTLIGTDITTPFSVTWSNVPAGTYTLTAHATDNAGAVTVSTARSVTVTPPNQPPTVSLTAPADGASYTAPASITVSASASDADGSVTVIEFYADFTLIGSDTSNPFSITWSNAAEGSYSLVAVARDNADAMTSSAARMVTVVGSTMPTRAVFTPSSNHGTAVDRYFLEIFPEGADPTAANPVGTLDLGKPPVIDGQCEADVRQTIIGLSPGRYIATVTAIGSDGSARSDASPPFTR